MDRRHGKAVLGREGTQEAELAVLAGQTTIFIIKLTDRNVRFGWRSTFNYESGDSKMSEQSRHTDSRSKMRSSTCLRLTL